MLDEDEPPWFRRFRSVLAVAFLTSVAMGAFGCAHTPIQPTPVPKVACLPFTSYTLLQQQQAAIELAGLPPGSVVALMVTDYERMRDADRAACGAPTVRPPNP